MITIRALISAVANGQKRLIKERIMITIRALISAVARAYRCPGSFQL
jgi:hypothetical protein